MVNLCEHLYRVYTCTACTVSAWQCSAGVSWPEDPAESTPWPVMQIFSRKIWFSQQFINISDTPPKQSTIHTHKNICRKLVWKILTQSSQRVCSKVEGPGWQGGEWLWWWGPNLEQPDIIIGHKSGLTSWQHLTRTTQAQNFAKSFEHKGENLSSQHCGCLVNTVIMI